MNGKDREDISEPDFSYPCDDDEILREEGMALYAVLEWLSEVDDERNAVDKELNNMLNELRS